MLIIGGPAKLRELVAAAVEAANHKASTEAQTFMEKYRKIADLEKEVTRLTIEADRKKEEWERREREIEHKIGLERKRQEFEIQQAKRDTSVTVREENLKADKERFKAEMDFQRERLQGEVASLRELVTQMLQRLPSAEIYAEIGGKNDA